MKKIVLLSKNIQIANMVKDGVEGAGYEYELQQSVDIVASLVERHECDAVLLDIISTRQECYELLDMLTDRGLKDSLPLFFLAEDMDRFLFAPFEQEVLLTKLRRVVGDPEGKEKDILLIEDDLDIASILSINLQGKGYTVRMAHDGEAGLAEVAKKQPSLIVLDLGLPKLPGTEVCKKIREDETTEHIPIIMLTAKAEDVDRIIGKVIGANEYMTKPFNIDDVINKIEEILAEKENA